MVKIGKDKNSLEELLNTIIKISSSSSDVQFTEKGHISELIISDDYKDIKINMMQIHPNLKYSTLSDYYVLLSVNDGKRYEPVLYFTKTAYINKENFEKQKPDLNSIGKDLSPSVFSNTLDDYYKARSLEYKFDVKYLKKGKWVQAVLKFAQIQDDKFKGLERLFDNYNYKGEI